jgi:hypothetical protein
VYVCGVVCGVVCVWCVYVCVYVCVCVCICMCMCGYVGMWVCGYVCMCVCVYVCMCVCVYLGKCRKEKKKIVSYIFSIEFILIFFYLNSFRPILLEVKRYVILNLFNLFN